MTRSLVAAASLAAVLGLAALGCGSRDDSLAREVEGYEVVDEGSVSGVTSTIHAPGEVIAPVVEGVPGMTGTSLDTTTAFSTLDPVLGVPPTQTTTDTLASSLPQTSTAYPSVAGEAPRFPPTRTAPPPVSTPQLDIRRSTPAPAEPEPDGIEPVDENETESTTEAEQETEPEPTPDPQPETEPQGEAAEDSPIVP